MFVSLNQFFIFIASVSIGGISAVIFTFFMPIIALIKNKILRNLLNFFSIIFIGIFYIIASYLLKFPSIRLYMIVGVFVGILLYIKSFHITLAKLFKKVYKIIKQKKVKLFRWKRQSLGKRL